MAMHDSSSAPPREWRPDMSRPPLATRIILVIERDLQIPRFVLEKTAAKSNGIMEAAEQAEGFDQRFGLRRASIC